MKKILLALLVLTVAVPAMGAVTINSRKGDEANSVIVGYSWTGTGDGNEVRAFALDVNVSDGAYVAGSSTRRSTEYYVTPTNITFTTVGGNTYINQLGKPAVAETVNGCVIEMASLYAAGDPCGHTSPPPVSGELVKFFVDCTKAGGDGKVGVNVASETTLRGGVVLKNGNSVAPTLPGRLDIVCAPPVPPCWTCISQPLGDTDGDGYVGALDLLALRMSWTKAPPDPAYNCCADFDHDSYVGALDLLVLRMHWTNSGLGTCLTNTCP
jgi:hypothetical protein